jgi:NAD(P)-dependent dehydrogenase (short-subunit alcohol dehydrogenase family)
MEVSLKDRVIIVTGGTQGVGEKSAALAAASGASGLLITGRNEARGKAVADRLSSATCRAVFFQAELGEPDAPDAVVKAALSTFGRVDGLVNAAAVTDRAGLDDATIEEWDRQFAINARAPFFLTQGVARDMKARKAPGSIVNILSVNAHCGSPELAIYSATKGAMLTVTRNTANSLLPDRIRVNGINLGWTLTPGEHEMQAHKLGKGENWAEEAAKTQPLGRMLTDDETAQLVVFLLSDASGLLTGSLIDLGQTVLGAPPYKPAA